MPGHKDWIKKAHGDLKAAKLLIQDQEIFDIAAFHSHQCAEKALKGFLMFSRQPIPKTHNLEELLKACSNIDRTYIELRHDAFVLDPYPLNARYPNDNFFIDEKEVQESIGHALRIFTRVQNLIE